MQDFVPLNNNHMIQKEKKDKKETKKRYKDSHAPRPLFSSGLKYFPHSANINLRVWSLFHHDTSILAFHLGFIFNSNIYFTFAERVVILAKSIW